MANQLCHSAETNHCIAESITVSHGNTSAQVSLFIKLDSPPTPVSVGWTRVTWGCLVFAPSQPSPVARICLFQEGLEISHLNEP